MRKGRDGGNGKKNGKKKKRRMKIVATTSLPAVDHPNADRWNAAHLCQKHEPLEVENPSYSHNLQDTLGTHAHQIIDGIQSQLIGSLGSGNLILRNGDPDQQQQQV